MLINISFQIYVITFIKIFLQLHTLSVFRFLLKINLKLKLYLLALVTLLSLTVFMDDGKTKCMNF